VGSGWKGPHVHQTGGTEKMGRFGFCQLKKKKKGDAKKTMKAKKTTRAPG